MLMKARQVEDGHMETVLEAAVRRQLERLSEAERQRKASRRRACRLWRSKVVAEV